MTAKHDIRHVITDAPRVMVVDGSKLVRKLIADVLKRDLPNVQVIGCASIAEARALALALAEAGVHTMVEKPIAHTTEAGRRVAVVGESMGGSVATAAFGSDRPPDADRVVLLAPGVWGWSSQGWLNSAALSVAARMAGGYAATAPDFIAMGSPSSRFVMEPSG